MWQTNPQLIIDAANVEQPDLKNMWHQNPQLLKQTCTTPVYCMSTTALETHKHHAEKWTSKNVSEYLTLQNTSPWANPIRSKQLTHNPGNAQL